VVVISVLLVEGGDAAGEEGVLLPNDSVPLLLSLEASVLVVVVVVVVVVAPPVS
jgi:hypothetical protein